MKVIWFEVEVVKKRKKGCGSGKRSNLIESKLNNVRSQEINDKQDTREGRRFDGTDPSTSGV